MSVDFYITARNNPMIFKANAVKGGAIDYTFDFSPWAEEHETVSTVTWTVKNGQAAVSGQTLASNVAQALVTTSEAGGSLIEIKAAGSTETFITHLDILAKDPNRNVSDYGLCSC